MVRPTSARLSDGTAKQLRDLTERYGNQTTALTVAIDRLWRDTIGREPTQRAAPDRQASEQGD